MNQSLPIAIHANNLWGDASDTPWLVDRESRFSVHGLKEFTAIGNQQQQESKEKWLYKARENWKEQFPWLQSSEGTNFRDDSHAAMHVGEQY